MLLRTLCTLAALALLAPHALASDPDTAGMKRTFDAMDKALAGSDADAFAALWHPEGFAANLVGSSGLSGRQVYGQGSRKGWFLKPHMDRITSPTRGAPTSPDTSAPAAAARPPCP